MTGPGRSPLAVACPRCQSEPDMLCTRPNGAPCATHRVRERAAVVTRERVPFPRYASPQAWARVRAAVGPGEVIDLARDVVDHAGRVSPRVAALVTSDTDRAALAAAVAHALTVADWSGPGYRQG